MDKKELTERYICTKLINPALTQAGWDIQSQLRESISWWPSATSSRNA